MQYIHSRNTPTHATHPLTQHIHSRNTPTHATHPLFRIQMLQTLDLLDNLRLASALTILLLLLLLLSHRTVTPIPKGPHFLTFHDFLLLLFVDILLHPWHIFSFRTSSSSAIATFTIGCVRMNSVRTDSFVDATSQCFWAGQC